MTERQSVFPDRKFCTEFLVLPQKPSPDGTRVWYSEDSDLSIINYIEYRTRSQVILCPASSTELKEKIDRYYGGNNHREIFKSPGIDNNNVPENPVVGETVERIDRLIGMSIRDNVSDLHFEPGERELTCRMRLDGVLHEREKIARAKTPEIISRLKIMAGLDIAEKRRPQDGRIRFRYEERMVDIRVSVIPTDFGEKIVLRILDKQNMNLDLNMIGFSPEQLKLFRDKIRLPHGIILITGPTGSGKTTTLYAALNSLRSPLVNISTVEDPIEYNLEGINQTQVKPEISLTFAVMLRALLRQDPDIIMIGEIRDKETLDIAIRASLTGHLVLSTVHTNNAVATITRLIDMGAEPFLLASCLKLVVAQRLVRRNCQSCRQYGWDDSNRAAAGKVGIEPGFDGVYGKGCRDCHGIGYLGRTALCEVLSINEILRNAILDKRGEAEILSWAKKNGFKTMDETAREIIRTGVTTPCEVLRETSV